MVRHVARRLFAVALEDIALAEGEGEDGTGRTWWTARTTRPPPVRHAARAHTVDSTIPAH